MPTLFDPVQLGSLVLANRVFMAPLTRTRADNDGVPSKFAATYYSQRASAGLIVTEATQISYLSRPTLIPWESLRRSFGAGWPTHRKAARAFGQRPSKLSKGS